jgi:hypothetical protein
MAITSLNLIASNHVEVEQINATFSSIEQTFRSLADGD